MAQAQAQRDPVADNAMKRAYCVRNGLDMKQQIFQQTLSGTIGGQVVTVPFRNVGLIKRFVVEISFSIAQTAAETLTRTTLGPANFLSQVVLTDLSNQTRISTTGWHLHLLASVRRGAAFGAVFTNDSQTGLGANNFNAMKCPTPVTTVQTGRMFYEIPVSYSDDDLRGGIWSNVINATGQLQLTVNGNFTAASGADATNSVYQSSTAAQAQPTGVVITVYQEYLDQLPVQALPMLDLSQMYLLNNTTITGLAAAQDMPIPYANFREFLSTTVIFDNNGTLAAGTDVNYFALQTANLTNLWKLDPYKVALETRNLIGNDMPLGTYYFDHRRRPVNTIQFGNMQLVVNPVSVASATGSFFQVGWEAMAVNNIVTQAGSLPAG